MVPSAVERAEPALNEPMASFGDDRQGAPTSDGSDRPDHEAPGGLPLTPRAARTLKRARRIAIEMSHNYIGTEHLLLALAADPQGVAGHVLNDFGIGDEVRERVLAALDRQRA